MRIDCHPIYGPGPGTQARRGAPGRRAGRRPEGGFTVFVMLVLLVIMAALAVGNNVALGHLQQELRLIERRQQQRQSPVVSTNAQARLDATAMWPPEVN